MCLWLLFLMCFSFFISLFHDPPSPNDVEYDNDDGQYDVKNDVFGRVKHIEWLRRFGNVGGALGEKETRDHQEN